MKLLVLAQKPPPLHGQSAMVAQLVDGLRDDPKVKVRHVNLGLSRRADEIGRFRPGKLSATLAACLAALRIRRSEGPMLLYYVPAPGRRVPLYRDWIVMALCRPWFSGIVLHWHATGLSGWLRESGTAPERALTRWLLGRPALSIALGDELRGDAEWLASRRIEVVPNGIPDPLATAPSVRRPRDGRPFEVLFLGLGSEEKGLFDTVGAVAELEQLSPGQFRLTFAGTFPGPEEERRFRALARPGVIEHAGFADAARKAELLGNSDALCLPTYYPHEGQPLVLLEALARDLPVITTRWRGIPGIFAGAGDAPGGVVHFVEPRSPAGIAAALRRLRESAAPAGAARRLYMERFTVARWLARMSAALSHRPDRKDAEGA